MDARQNKSVFITGNDILGRSGKKGN